MQFLRLASIAILLAGATLALKLEAQENWSAADQAGLYRDIAKDMHGDGYSSAIAPHMLFAYLTLERDGCRALIAEIDPDGTTLARMRRDAREVGPAKLVFRGSEVDAIPRFGPQFRTLIQRNAAVFGVKMTRDPVLLLATNGRCKVGPRDLAGYEITMKSRAEGVLKASR
ncbi:hypothetical protein ACXYL9_02225 [Qipengyuania sp. CAU 1752]